MLIGRVAIITDDPGWHGRALKEAFNQRGYDAEFVSLTECKIVIDESSNAIVMPGFEAKLPDAIFVRGVPGGSVEEVVYYLDILHIFKAIGIPVYNDAFAIEKSVDKAMTSFLLQKNGLPTPVTWVLRNRDKALALVENELAAGKIIMSKPLFGSQGEGIRRFDKMTDAMWLFSASGIYYLQKFVQCSGKGFSDIRVFVINGKAVAAMRRWGKSWLNNVARGARCETVQIDAALEQLALKAVDALKMDYAGVDIIQDLQGQYLVIEVNSIPAWKGLQSVCDLDIAQLMVDDLLNRHLSVAI